MADNYELIERNVNEVLWYYIMQDGYDGYGVFENETFFVKPYSWINFEDLSPEEQILENPVIYDNTWQFWHKPSGVRISWYKYPLRNPMCNIPINHEQMYAVLQDSMNSVSERKDKKVKVDTFNKWWEVK